MSVDRLGTFGGQGVLCLRGPLTKENILSFQNAIRREENSDTVIIDFSEVPFVDSSGLGSLVTAYLSRQKLGRGIALCGVNERVYHLLEITKLDSVFLIFPTIDEAMAALTGAAEA
ncbi:MAG: STAS domain-containing protein [Terriglobales bacterium]